ncbi:MAG: hypothetical protein IPL73_06705 [Candidatus Obscuribacter sp.]|nr:hypothetical protein [Candidatus Obscuribacter sp.]
MSTSRSTASCRRLCHVDPDKRFQSADELADQLLGVMREEAAREGTHRNIGSTIFCGDVMALRDLSVVPMPSASTSAAAQKDLKDPATEQMLLHLSSDPKKQTAALAALVEQYPDSMEARLAIARNAIVLGDYAEAEKHLTGASSIRAGDFRITWLKGMLAMAQGQSKQAYECFPMPATPSAPGERAPSWLSDWLSKGWATLTPTSSPLPTTTTPLAPMRALSPVSLVWLAASAAVVTVPKRCSRSPVCHRCRVCMAKGRRRQCAP